MSRLKKFLKRGDTIIEVTLAITVFFPRIGHLNSAHGS